MIYWQLFITFFKIGLISFGGGYGMIPIIQRELQAHNWMSAQDFIKIISLSEMTPGPIAINTATFVGYKISGMMGGAIATIGLVLPSLILILSASHFLYKYKSHHFLERVLYGIRPVVLSLIIVATIFIGKNTLFNDAITIKTISNLNSASKILSFINPFCIGIMIISIIMLKVFKLHPIFVLLIAGVIGVILNYLGFL